MKISAMLPLATILICISQCIASAEIVAQHDSQWLEQLNTRHSGVLPAFDGQLGTMTGWEIDAESHITGWIDFYNSDSVSHDIVVTVAGWFVTQTSVGQNGGYQSLGNTSKTISLSLPAYDPNSSVSPTSIYVDIHQNTGIAKDSPTDLIGANGYISLAYTGMGWIEYTMQNAPINGVNASLHNWTCSAQATAYYRYNPVSTPEPSALAILISGIAGTVAVIGRRKQTAA